MRATLARLSLLALCVFFCAAPAANAGNRVHSVPAAPIDHSLIDLKSIAGPLVYATVPGINSGGLLEIYDAHFHKVGQVSIAQPNGVAVDAAHNVYVTDVNDNNTLVFKRGATKPFRTLNAFSGQFPVDVTVGPDGTAYVSENDPSSGEGGNIGVFPPGASNPPTLLVVGTTEGGMIFTYVTSDAAGNVFAIVTGESSGIVNLYEFAKGANPAIKLKADVQGLHASGLAATPSGDLAVCDDKGVQVFKRTGKSPVKTLSIGCEYLKFTPKGNQLLAIDGSRVARYTYPGGTAIGSGSTTGEASGVAADSPASR